MVFVADLAAGGKPRPIIKQDPAEGRLSSCGWISDQRIVCNVRDIVNDAGTLLGFNRLFAINADWSKQAMLTADTNSRSLGYAQAGAL